MHLLVTDPLFAWDKLPDSPSLAIVREVLQLLPDQKLLAALQAQGNRLYIFPLSQYAGRGSG